MHEFLQEMHREVFAGRAGRSLTVGEMPGVTVEEARLFTDPARQELDMVFQFEHVNLDQGSSKWDIRALELRELKKSLGRWQTGLAETGWNSLYWGNHDQPRAVSRFGDDGVHRVASAKSLATVLHLHRGTPYIYQGDELGMTNMPFASLAEFRDIESVNHHREAAAGGADEREVLAALRVMSRDNARTPMQWTAQPRAGFTTGTPWIPVNPNHVEINAEAQVGDPGSVWSHYRALIALRHTEPAVVDGDFTMLLPDHPAVYAFSRHLGRTQILVLANLSGGPAEAAIADAQGWATAHVLLASHPSGAVRVGPPTAVAAGASRTPRVPVAAGVAVAAEPRSRGTATGTGPQEVILLGPWESLVLRRERP
jgi:oligo-1,6-glucosidase